ncbi:MAG: hypothetical protein RLZZ352_428 [Pseudomonadota bacterium]|jgi:hypothetical protein
MPTISMFYGILIRMFFTRRKNTTYRISGTDFRLRYRERRGIRKRNPATKTSMSGSLRRLVKTGRVSSCAFIQKW